MTRTRLLASIAFTTITVAAAAGGARAAGHAGASAGTAADAAAASSAAAEADISRLIDGAATESLMVRVAAQSAFCAGRPEWKAVYGARPPRPAAGARPAPPRPPEFILDARVNGDPASTGLQAICLATGRLAIPAEDWKALRLRPTRPITLPDGRVVYALESLPGVRYAVDALSQTIDITAPAEVFDGAKIDARPTEAEGARPPPLGGYLTYDASLAQASGVTSWGVDLQGVAFSRYGLLVGGATVSGTGSDARVVRGDTYFQRPFVKDMTILTLGDAIGVGGAWSRPVRFAGIRYSRDFETRPGFITFPMPSLRGSAALPSMVDVLVNNEKRLTSPVASGPFDLTNVPIVTGAGQMQLVVTDALGRQSVVTQSYYMAPSLLAPGLTDFSYEAGVERLNFGSASFDYGRFIADATYRRGLTTWLTAEARGEAEQDRGAMGLGLSTVVGRLGQLDAAAAYAIARGEEGGNYRIGFQSTGRSLGYSVGLQYFDRGYRPFAETAGEVRPKAQVTAGGGWQAPRAGAFSFNYVYQSQWDGSVHEFVNAGWTRDILRGLNAGVSANHDLRNGAWTAQFSLGFTLGGRTALSTTVQTSDTGTGVFASAASPIPTGPGLGWSLRASSIDEILEGSVLYNAPEARLTADVTTGRGGTAVRVGAAGSVGMVAGYGFASRPIDGAFAVVRAGGVAGAPISLWNQPAAVTGRNGVALVTGLGAYQDARIGVDPNALPIDVEVNGDSVIARPWARAGVFVDVPVRRTRAALVVLRRADGSPVPLGATVSLGERAAPPAKVAMRGEVWLSDLAEQNTLTVAWDGGGCTLHLVAPRTLTPGQKLGPLICGEGARR